MPSNSRAKSKTKTKIKIKRCKRIVLFNGAPEVSTTYVGTYWQPEEKRDRWGHIHCGAVRSITADVKECRALLAVPRKWFGKRNKIHLRIVAEISEIS